MKTKSQHVESSESDDETKPLRCAFCDFSSIDLSIFVKHFKKRHYKLPAADFICDQCDFTCNDHYELKAHLKTHLRKGIFCEKCDFPADSPEMLRTHTLKVHMFKRYVCYYCGMSRTFKYKLMRHMFDRHIFPNDFAMKERKRPPVKAASSNDRFISFVGNPNDKNTSLVCQKCPYKTNSRLKFMVHQRQHIEPNPGSVSFSLTCTECTFETVSVSILRDHVKTHRAVPNTFNCSRCSYKTNKLKDLQSHEKKHNQPPSFSCNLCNFSCNQMNVLKTHKLTHKAAVEPSDSNKENKFFCTFEKCNFTCASLTDLADHSEIAHRGNGAFDCSHCDFTCTSLTRLNEHEASHVKRLRVYQCENCSFSVANYVKFKKHVKSHLDHKEASFDCSSCDFTCGSLKELLVHEQKHAH